MRSVSSISVLAACALSISSALAAPVYRYVDLGLDTAAADINDHGVIVGSKEEQAAVLRNGTWRVRPAGTSARAIDGQGEVIGHTTNEQAGSFAALYWPYGGGASILITMPFDNVQVIALDVASGRVVGYSEDLENRAHCYLWTAATGTATDLGTGRQHYCYARGINDAGQVVGQTMPPDSLESTAFIWHNGTFQFLGTLPGGTWSDANAINRKGHVAMTATRRRHDGGFVWRPALYNGHRIIDLGILEHSVQGEATALNDRDEVLGRYYSQSARAWKPFLYTDGQIYALEDLVQNLHDRKLSAVGAIADDGTIVGFWQDGLEHRGFRLERVDNRAGSTR